MNTLFFHSVFIVFFVFITPEREEILMIQEEQVRQLLRQAHYLANQQKIHAAVSSGLPVLDYGGYGPCQHCQSADHDTMTAADDSFQRVICCNPDCQYHLERH